MAEYIDKKQAIDRIASCYCMDCEHSNGILCRACEHQDDMDLIDDMPSAEPERKTGKWIPDKSGIVYWNCSECGFASEAFGADILYHFCPNCGCDMRS